MSVSKGGFSFSISSFFPSSLFFVSINLASGSLDFDFSFLVFSRKSFLPLDLDLDESELEELPLELEPLELLREEPLELLELEPALPFLLLRGEFSFLLLGLLPRFLPRSSSFLSSLLPDLDLFLSLSFLSTLRSLPRRFEFRRSGDSSLLPLRFLVIMSSYRPNTIDGCTNLCYVHYFYSY